MNGWIHFFGAPDSRLDLAGGKGRNLSRLSQARMPVPPGFVVTTSAYRAFVDAHNLEPKIQALYRSASLDNPASFDAAADSIRQLFVDSALDGEILSCIERAYDELCQLVGRTVEVAVRSSAAAEDSAEASFAGQHDTFLNVNARDMPGKVKLCWSSLWTARSIAYRAHHPGAAVSAELAVVVQQFVRAQASGVTFTANPLTGARDEAVINAVWGLGEALVGGSVTPDNFVVDKKTGRAKQITVADKRVETVPSTNGTVEHQMPPGKATARVLNENHLQLLVKLGCAVEDRCGAPQDMEWCLEDDSLYILQTRPITALPPEIHWRAPGNRKWVHGGGAIELLTEPVSTLLETLFVPLFDRTLHDWMQRLGLSDGFGWPIVRGVNGFMYVCLDVHLRLRHIPGVLRDLREHMNSMEQWPAELAEYRSAVARLSYQAPEAVSAAGLVTRVESLLRAALRYWIHLTMIAQPIYRAERRFIKFHSSVQNESDPAPEVMLRGLEMRPVAAERSVYELAILARDSPGETLHPGFLSGLTRHLDQFGHQIYSFDPLLPTLSEDPKPVLAAVRSYLEGKEPPGERWSRLATERIAALQDIELRLSGRKQRKYRLLLDRAQRAARLREDALFELGLAWKPLRESLLDVGRRMVERQAISKPDDVFWLTHDELTAAAEGLEGRGALAPSHDQVGLRRAAWSSSQVLQPPYILPLGSKPKFWWKYVFPMPELRPQSDAGVIQGLGVSPGKVTATARVIKTYAEIHRLSRGEILVTHTTTPAWTPLFACAAALVTDLGGPLTHGSIVAREYGIPAVMGTGSATRRIKDGQSVTVDGSNGRVYASTPM